jgi:GWxTD domain-containing protein
MKLLVCSFVFLILLKSLSAQIENYNQEPYSFKTKYYQDFLSFASDQRGKTRVDIFIQVPYVQIQFLKVLGGFRASYTVTVSVFDEDKEKLLVEKSWREKIETPDFEETTSKGNYNLSLKSFYLIPNKYFIRTTVEDEDSKITYSSENIYTVRDFSGDVSVSDIMLISKQTKVEGNNKILPNISGNITVEMGGIPVFFEIYSKQPESVNIKFQIEDREEKIVYDTTLYKDIDTGHTQIIQAMENISLGLGKYTLKVMLFDSANKYIAGSDKVFISRWIGIPSSVNDLDEAILQLVYIATPSELNYMKEASTRDEKISRYREFWKKKDPTPNTEENEVRNEYYRRVAYANANFSHYIEGWRSDRGMVFILLGSPNNVDRHPFDLESKPYEVWQYYELNRNFVFVDETGFGDYHLVTPLYGDEYWFRN